MLGREEVLGQGGQSPGRGGLGTVASARMNTAPSGVLGLNSRGSGDQMGTAVAACRPAGTTGKEGWLGGRAVVLQGTKKGRREGPPARIERKLGVWLKTQIFLKFSYGNSKTLEYKSCLKF